MQAPGQVQRGSGEGSEGSGERLGGFGAEPSQVQQGSGEGSGVGLGSFGAEPGQGSGSTGFRRRFRRRPGKLWCGARSCSTGFWRRFPRTCGKLWCRARSGSQGSVWEALVQSQVKFNRVPEKIPEKVWEALEHARCFQRFRKICENKTLRLLGISPKLMCYLFINLCTYVFIFYSFTSSTAQGAGGSFKK